MCMVCACVSEEDEVCILCVCVSEDVLFLSVVQCHGESGYLPGLLRIQTCFVYYEVIKRELNRKHIKVSV